MEFLEGLNKICGGFPEIEVDYVRVYNQPRY
jgi:hypothetical protein